MIFFFSYSTLISKHWQQKIINHGLQTKLLWIFHYNHWSHSLCFYSFCKRKFFKTNLHFSTTQPNCHFFNSKCNHPTHHYNHQLSNSPRVIEHRVNTLLVNRVFADCWHRFTHLQSNASASTRISNVSQSTICFDQKSKSWRWWNASIYWLECLLGDDGGGRCFDGWISIHFLWNCRHHNYFSLTFMPTGWKLEYWKTLWRLSMM
jgi:hypothetical protein